MITFDNVITELSDVLEMFYTLWSTFLHEGLTKHFLHSFEIGFNPLNPVLDAIKSKTKYTNTFEFGNSHSLLEKKKKNYLDFF